MKIRILPVLVASAVLGGCATALAQFDFENVDTNNDSAVSRAEFRSFLDTSGVFAREDVNNDRTLSQQEYRAAVHPVIESDAYFRGFDRDSNGQLTMQEFADGIFTAYDRDRNDRLDRAEFESAYRGVVLEI